jgi:hypothetical protein
LGALLARHQERLQGVVSFRLDPRLRGRIDATDVIQETLIAATVQLQRVRQVSNNQRWESPMAASVIFAIGRMPGWIAHWKEVRDSSSRIHRPRQVYIGPTARDYVDRQWR